MNKKVTAVLLAVCLMLTCVACTQQIQTLTTEALGTEHELKFGGVYIHMTQEEFLDLGFEFGDSVDVSFSNGYALSDIPFYSGYYGRTGEALLCAYQGYPYIKLCRNNGADVYPEAELDEDCTAVISLNKRGKYLTVQNTMSMVYSTERDDFDSDAGFANFRAMSGGALADSLFYRAASPCDDQYNRAEYSSALCAGAGIGYILDLADDADELAEYFADETLDCPYWKQLYSEGKVLPLAMSVNIQSEGYKAAVATAMRAVLTEDGSFLIHCTEGKDRTGFVCLLVEALAGASRDELETDYMTTYANYYGFTEQSDPEKYAAVKNIKFDDMLVSLCGTESVTELSADVLRAAAEAYLSSCGMSSDEITVLENTIRG